MQIFYCTNAVNNNTLLGIDLLTYALICLNIPNEHWSFTDNPNERYLLYFESDSLKSEVYANSFEGHERLPEQRKRLAALLGNNQYSV